MRLLKHLGDKGAIILFTLSIAVVALTFANFMIDIGFALFYCVAFVLNFLSVLWFCLAGSRTMTSKKSLVFSCITLCLMLAVHDPRNALALIMERSH